MTQAGIRRIKWGMLLFLVSCFLVMQHLGQSVWYEAMEHGSGAPELRDPPLERQLGALAKSYYRAAIFAAAGAGVAFMFLLVGRRKQGGRAVGSILVKPRAALFLTAVTVASAGLLIAAYYGLDRSARIALGPVFMRYLFSLGVATPHLAYFAMISNIMCLLRGTIGLLAGLAGGLVSAGILLVALTLIIRETFGQFFHWIGLF